jgi:hypothetical protein
VFTVSPTSGVEVTTQFLMQASGWIDGDELDYPLSYSFKYQGAYGADIDLVPAWPYHEYYSELPYNSSS